MTDVAKMARAYEGSFVRRYACHPRLGDIGQSVGQHSHGVALILLMLHPSPSRGLLVEAIAHDLAERLAGDLPRPFKQRHTHFANQHRDLEARIRADMLPPRLSPSDLSANDLQWLHAADALECHLFAAVKAPAVAMSALWLGELEQIVGAFRHVGGESVAGQARALLEELIEQWEGGADGI